MAKGRKEGKEIEDLIEEALTENVAPLMRGAQFMAIIEFGRSVHAEMAALMDAAVVGLLSEAVYCTLLHFHAMIVQNIL